MNTNTRPTTEAYFMNLVFHVATRGSCTRRKVGCILVDMYGHILSTGYNGPPRNFEDCLTHPCEGSKAESGTDLHKCNAVHAEANALLQCQDVNKITTAYVTTSPCIECTKMLLNTTCYEIIYAEEYPHENAKEMWLKQKRFWRQSNYITSYSDALQTVNIISTELY